MSANSSTGDSGPDSGLHSVIAVSILLALAASALYVVITPFGLFGTMTHMAAGFRGDLVDAGECTSLVYAEKYHGQAIAKVAINGYARTPDEIRKYSNPCFTNSGDPEGFYVRYELADGSEVGPGRSW